MRGEHFHWCDWVEKLGGTREHRQYLTAHGKEIYTLGQEAEESTDSRCGLRIQNEENEGEKQRGDVYVGVLLRHPAVVYAQQVDYYGSLRGTSVFREMWHNPER